MLLMILLLRGSVLVRVLGVVLVVILDVVEEPSPNDEPKQSDGEGKTNPSCGVVEAHTAPSVDVRGSYGYPLCRCTTLRFAKSYYILA